ncbi:MAG: hypothetical protein LiPW30_89 [Parcubacteria group bacterium LiPW_30]|nr:MAG: hypothetical protein LiPW30_89 [Parcubacteria group bacterium LiPW_30]
MSISLANPVIIIATTPIRIMAVKLIVDLRKSLLNMLYLLYSTSFQTTVKEHLFALKLFQTREFRFKRLF